MNNDDQLIARNICSCAAVTLQGMAKTGIIGGGAFGTALACVIRRSGHDVTLWAREPEVVAAINNTGVNSVYLPHIPLVPGIRATEDIAEATRNSDFILLAAPAQHVRTVAGSMRSALRKMTPVVTCAKGIERGSCALMPEVVADMLPEAIVTVLSGPSFAREIAIDQPCGVVLACKDWSAGELLARQISNPNFCVHLSSDLMGVAIGGVMKNVIAIASGIAAGRKLGENARATLVTLGLAEATRLGIAKGGEAETFLGLAGVGDFMLTAHSLQSRNTSLGVALGQGRMARDVLAERREVTEGAFSVDAVAALARQLHVDMPITAALDALLNGNITLDAAIEQLMKHLPALCHVGQRPGQNSGGA